MASLCLKGKSVLVTGGAGAIGSNLVERLASRQGCSVTVVDDLSQGRLSNLKELQDRNKIRFIQGDVNNESVLEQAFQNDIEVVYHLAARFANELSVEQPLPDLESNIKGTLNLIKRAVEAKVKLFVYASSSSIYGPRKEIRLKESLLPNPSTPYAVSKLTGEFYCKSMEHLYNLNHIVLRFSNTYGPKDFPGRYRNVIPNFIRRALKDQPLLVTGTGRETRDYTYIADCIDGIIGATESEKATNQIFNLGTGKATRTIDLAKAIFKVTGSKSRIEFVGPRYFDHIKNRVMDVTKAKKTFSYSPKTSLQEGLERTLEWFLAHKEEALGES